MESRFFTSIVDLVSSMLKHTLPFTIQRNQHTKDMCPFVAYCVFELEIVFRGLIFWQFLFLPAIVPNMNTRQI